MNAHTAFAMIAFFSAAAYTQQQGPVDEPERQFWIGYMGSMPHVPFGASLGLARTGSLGFYLAAKTNFKNRSPEASDFYDNISESQARYTFRDRQVGDALGIITVEGGITGRIVKNLFFYGGVGYAMSTQYYQFYDEYHILGDNGNYWIKASDEGMVSLNGGLVFFIEKGPYFMVGFDTSPGWVNLGIGYHTDP